MPVNLVVHIKVNRVFVKKLAGEGLDFFHQRNELLNHFFLQVQLQFLVPLLQLRVNGFHFVPGTLALQLSYVSDEDLFNKCDVFRVNAFDFLLEVVPDDPDCFLNDFFVFHPGGPVQLVDDLTDIFLLLELVGFSDHFVFFLEDLFVFLHQPFLELLLLPLRHQVNHVRDLPKLGFILIFILLGKGDQFLFKVFVHFEQRFVNVFLVFFVSFFVELAEFLV